MINLKKIENALIPCDEESVQWFNKIKIGDEVVVNQVKGRNMKFHRKYWKLLEAVVLNQDHYKTKENLHEAIKYKAGYYETIVPLNGSPFLKTKSIAVGSMTADDFAEFYEVALDECVALVSEDAVNEILRFI